MNEHQVHIIGGGLAGSEAAWQLANAGIRVKLSEMRGAGDMTPAHQTDGLAELVCSNSFRSDDAERNAVGLLHQEMRDLGSIIMAQGDLHKVPAGSALAVDRDHFSAGVTAALEAHPNITIVRERVDQLPAEGLTIVATGPLTAPGLADSIGSATGKDSLAFFDALAPPPVETALGAWLGHNTGGAEIETYQPMNVNFGLMPPIEGRTKKADRKLMYTARGRAAFAEWLKGV